jgi:pectinesterase
LAAAPLIACGGPDEHADVVYDDRFAATRMDVYVPDGPGTHAGVMFVHGGSWSGGGRWEYAEAAQRLARSGWVAATIDYRLVPDGVYPRLVQDCVCALSFLRAHAAEYKLDPARIAVMGYSAGGHLASLVGVAADDPLHAPDCRAGPTTKPRAVIAGAGWYDMRGQTGAVFRALMGGTEADAPAKWVEVSPITHVQGGEPPFLFVNGTQDLFVGIAQARAMRDALAASGNDAHVLELAGGGHLLNRTTDLGDLALEEEDLTPEAWIAVTDFLERTLGAP